MNDTISEVETFYDKQRRIERENMTFIRLLGERDVEIARLREALQAIVVECDGCGQIPSVELRTVALRALEKSEVR